MGTRSQREPSSPADIQAALSGGVPMGRWQEGLMFGGINPTPGLARPGIKALSPVTRHSPSRLDICLRDTWAGTSTATGA